ncbi:MAG: PAS domain S-box protein [Nitrospirae bacterium]|nr:PAS domain S-box protein [Nitrospirota bacterium]
MAVVAPISEVAGAIHGIQLRQFSLEVIVILSILSGGLLIIGIMLSWSSSLKNEVEEKTKELRKSENLYRSLIENADDIIFTVDRGGSILSMNKFGCKFYRKSVIDIIGNSLGEICLNEESTALQFKAIDEVFNTRMSKQITYPVTIKGDEHWLITNFSGLLDEKGDVFAVLGIARDITERKKMEEQMFYTEKLASMGTLAAGVAHEINNPLTIILGFSDLLLEKRSQSAILTQNC